MFTDIQAYKVDLKKYYEELQKVVLSEESEKQKKELDSIFKDKVRKYLPTCLNIVNTNFNCKFSLYKEGKDYDSAMRMVDTKVKKTKEEVENELNYYYSNMSNSIAPNEKPNLDLALEILKVYVDDNFYNNITQSKYLNEAVSMQVESNPGDTFKPAANNLIPKTTDEIQYNPYAGQPIDYGNNNQVTESKIDSSNFGVGQANSVNNSKRAVSDKEFAYSDVIDASSLSIFNNPNKGN